MNRPPMSSHRLALGAALCLGLLPVAHAADPAAPSPAVEKVTVRAVAQFGFDRNGLRAQDQEQILEEVHKLKDVTWQTVTATGHTDSIGSAAYNEKLSARRAEAVKAYLVGKGLDPGMISTAAKASSVPAAPNDTAQGRAKNRRAEIEFQGVRATVAAR